MVDDLFDGLGLRLAGLVFCGAFGFGEDAGGDLEAVEEESGAAGVDLVGGDALENFTEGLLDGGAVFGDGELEFEGCEWAVFGRGFAGGVVVVAEVLVAERGRAAAVSGGEDVAALVAFGFHVSPCFECQSLQKKRPESGLLVLTSGLGLNAKARRLPGLYLYSFILTIRTKLMGTFLCACMCYMLFGLWGFPRVWGLDRKFSRSHGSEVVN